jgi:hypothetical protein
MMPELRIVLGPFGRSLAAAIDQPTRGHQAGSLENQLPPREALALIATDYWLLRGRQCTPRLCQLSR